MLLLAVVLTGATLTMILGVTLWRRSPWGGERVLAAGLLLLGLVFAWIASMPHVGGTEDRIVSAARAKASAAWQAAHPVSR
ncbi:hypothetical protein EDC65_5126 [Stella humosa]|uniref:Uncharacterized protein n=1 Tax=Stella humosa TaxID=94 RepID=A0A3N1KSA0_9PROT|nr:hypothetical protein [Stella humosa]ROP81270.1 hypothetical protein EDC65_5126 [Stella humosa]BBK32618.1 hypothetical protein STHU_32520 [Stella humosa]